jgi:hypothetical protein
MRPAASHLPMQSAAQHRELGCVSCHGAHGFDTVKAQVEACLGCHNDTHSKAYIGSPHHKLWLADVAREGSKASGVTCASCHMPRIRAPDESAGGARIFVNHNQNDNLRPNEKMLRSVCGDCHGTQFALNALADNALIQNNFVGMAKYRVESIDWASNRQQIKK